MPSEKRVHEKLTLLKVTLLIVENGIIVHHFRLMIDDRNINDDFWGRNQCSSF